MIRVGIFGKNGWVGKVPASEITHPTSTPTPDGRILFDDSSCKNVFHLFFSLLKLKENVLCIYGN